MTNVKCITWNVRGVRARPKRNAVLSCLKAQRAEVMVLVETHLTGQLLTSLRRPWVGWVYQAPHTANSRGVAVLVAKTAQFVMITLRSDPQGRYIFLHVKINGLELLLLAIYIPPPFQFEVLTDGLAFMSQFPTVPAVWLGDFNNVVDRDLDRLSSTPPGNPSHTHTRFGRLLLDLALVDTWRHRYPSDRMYSCFSTSHNTMSRIDLILVSRTLLPILGNVGFNPRALSDHSSYWIELRIDSPPTSYTWRLNPFWLTVVPDLEGAGSEWDFFFQTNRGTAPFGVVWDSFKSHARLILSQRISRYRKTSSLVVSQAEQSLVEAEREFTTNPSPAAAEAAGSSGKWSSL